MRHKQKTSIHILKFFFFPLRPKKTFAYHPSVPCFWARQVGNDGSAEADVALTNAPNYSKQKEHAEAPGNGPDRVGGHQPQLDKSDPNESTLSARLHVFLVENKLSQVDDFYKH